MLKLNDYTKQFVSYSNLEYITKNACDYEILDMITIFNNDAIIYITPKVDGRFEIMNKKTNDNINKKFLISTCNKNDYDTSSISFINDLFDSNYNKYTYFLRLKMIEKMLNIHKFVHIITTYDELMNILTKYDNIDYYDEYNDSEIFIKPVFLIKKSIYKDTFDKIIQLLSNNTNRGYLSDGWLVRSDCMEKILKIKPKTCMSVKLIYNNGKFYTSDFLIIDNPVLFDTDMLLINNTVYKCIIEMKNNEFVWYVKNRCEGNIAYTEKQCIKTISEYNNYINYDEIINLTIDENIFYHNIHNISDMQNLQDYNSLKSTVYEMIENIMNEKSSLTNAHILDIGCGYCNFYTYLKNNEFNNFYVGFDHNYSVLSVLYEKIYSDVILSYGDMNEIYTNTKIKYFKDRLYDWTIFIDSFDFVHDIEKMLNYLYNITDNILITGYFEHKYNTNMNIQHLKIIKTETLNDTGDMLYEFNYDWMTNAFIRKMINLDKITEIVNKTKWNLTYVDFSTYNDNDFCKIYGCIYFFK